MYVNNDDALRASVAITGTGIWSFFVLESLITCSFNRGWCLAVCSAEHVYLKLFFSTAINIVGQGQMAESEQSRCNLIMQGQYAIVCNYFI
jgi:hypothetical protein